MSTPPEVPSAQGAESQKAQNERLIYENEKLKYEVEELKRWRQKLYLGFLSAVVSSVVAVITFLIGQNASKSLDRIHANDALYQQALSDVASSDPSMRLSAVTSLKRFITAPPTPTLLNRLFSFSSNEAAEEQARQQRRRDAVVLLVSRLRTESDIGVIHETLSAIQEDDDIPIEDLADLNRIAQESFVDSAARLSAELFLFETRASRLDQDSLCEKLPLVKAVAANMENVILRSPSLTDSSGTPYPAFLIWPYIYSSVVESGFASRQRQFLNSDIELYRTADLYRVQDSSAINSATVDLVQKTIFLEATSIALSVAMDRRHGNSPIDLQRIALVTGRLVPMQDSRRTPTSLNLNGIDLNGSYIGIPADSVSFGGSDLSNCDLRQMQIGTDISFTNANLAGMIVGSGNQLRQFIGAGGLLSSASKPAAQIRSEVDAFQAPPYCSH